MTATEQTMRDVFVHAMSAALDDDPRIALVLADISADRFTEVTERHPDRIHDVGIREQAMVGVAGGLALAGLRPVLHTITPFLVERPYEQLKLDLGHQGVGAVAVSTGASYDYPGAGRTHMAPADVALLDTLPGWAVHVPGHPDELRAALDTALAGDDRVYLRMSEQVNAEPRLGGPGWQVVRHGTRGVVAAVGPTLDPVLAATAGLDVTVLYTGEIRPFDAVGLRAAAGSARPDVVLVEPYLRGTSAHEVQRALADLPHRALSLGVRRDTELRNYGTAQQHTAAHGLDAAGIAAEVRGFLG
ncbi:transketolase [Saccharopolyspora sp. HNM0983]|uniref:Transketolase n=1 Tax=Saccharopolyspora montiporae TaxID=2781240 RepID=A0A929G119_9PSEU|nr:transketolase [Saccharopolyspora sp. HNM0983]MBE9374213.1 transketolase [Saccharopolyspora sp. HNM0983]